MKPFHLGLLSTIGMTFFSLNSENHVIKASFLLFVCMSPPHSAVLK